MWRVKGSSFFTLVSHAFGYSGTEPAVTFISPCDQASSNEPWQPINALFITLSTSCKRMPPRFCGSSSALHERLASRQENCQTKERGIKNTLKTLFLICFWSLLLHCAVAARRWEVVSFCPFNWYHFRTPAVSLKSLFANMFAAQKVSCQNAGYEGMSDIILRRPYITRKRVSVVILLERRVAWTGNKTQFASSVPSF